jgi:hypothetical protein
VSQSLFLATPLFRPYHPKVPALQRTPARRTVLDLLSVSGALLEVVEEHPAVSLSDPPELPPELMPLRAWVGYKTTICSHLLHRANTSLLFTLRKYLSLS